MGKYGLFVTLLVVLILLFLGILILQMRETNQKSLPVVAPTVTAAPTVVSPTPVLTYFEDKNFSIGYPADFSQTNDQQFAANNDIVVLEKDKTFPNTVLTTRYVLEVRAAMAQNGVTSCYVSSVNGSTLEKTEALGKNLFHYSDPITGAAAGTHVTTYEYRIFREPDICLEFDLEHWESSDWNNPGDVKLAKDDQAVGLTELKNILSNFKFK